MLIVIVLALGALASAANARAGPTPPKETLPPEQQLESLARALRDGKSGAAYARLRSFARKSSSGELGLRAALALGYFDYQRRHYAEARAWLEKAEGDPVLREYAVYWSAVNDQAMGRSAEALASLENFRKEFPQGVMTEPALQALVEASLAVNQPGRGLAALADYPKTTARSPLLFARARAYEQSGQPVEAAADYLAVMNRFPLNPEADPARQKARLLEHELGERFPRPPLAEQLARAAALVDNRRWKDAREAFGDLLPQLSGADRDRAQLRIGECAAGLGEPPDLLAQLAFSEPDLEAERLDALAQAYRLLKQEEPMRTAVEAAVTRDPQGRWAEDALFAAGNYYWSNLDRPHALDYYRRVLEKFPSGRNAPVANWRVAWSAYLDGRPEAAGMLQEHLQRFPNSPFAANALYWLGRAAERAGDKAHAGGYYQQAQEHFPETYFGQLAIGRLQAVGGSAASADWMTDPPPAQSAPGPEIPEAAAERWKRAQALRTIAFDSSAELELQAAYAEAKAPVLLIEEAKAARDAGDYLVGANLVRQVFPQLESHFAEVGPADIWRLVYPLPYAEEIDRFAGKARIDPMLVAGLIRQESGFQADAVSRAGALGLMQVLPKTARNVARSAHVRYARQRLFEPGYNLRLGTTYLASLLRSFGSLEAALAAYNAGEDRVITWQAGRSFTEPAEFVESIPFTETREYVQIVIRNAEIYRLLYGESQ